MRRAFVFARRCGVRVPPLSSAILIFILLSSGLLQARVHRSQAWAEQQFNRAESRRETLQGRAEQAPTRREYESVIASYRRVVLEAPTSSKADGSAFQVAQLTAEMGRHFKDEMALYSSVREYKYLRREYPGSKHRVEALLAIGEIYKNDLGDEADARAAFEEFLRRYQHSDLIKEAKAELAALNSDSSGEEAAQSEESGPDDNATSAGSGKDDAGDDAPDKSDLPGASNATVTGKASKAKITRITAIEQRSEDDYTRITVDLEQDVQFVSQRIGDPDRIYFDLKNARLSPSLNGSTVDVSDGRVNKIRMAQYSADRARLVIETDGHASYNASLVLNPPRLVIDIHDNGTTKATTRRPDGGASPPKKVIVAEDDDDSADTSTDSADVPAKKTAAKSSLLVSKSARRGKTQAASAVPLREAQPTSDGERSLIRTLGLKIGKIVIDPGHGGHDTGTIGPNGLLEKDLVLDVSKRLGKLLSARMGAEVVFTRRDDTFIPLETRTSIANQEEADLFVSVHANSSHDPDARGVETYYLNFTSSPEALEVAARENAASDKSIHELQDLVKKIALKEKIEESREFASDVQQSLHNGLAAKNPGERDRGVKKAPFVVLIGANMPSILAEISFLSNPGDEHRLRTPEYRQRIAESLYRGIARYVNGLGGLKVASKIEKSSAD